MPPRNKTTATATPLAPPSILRRVVSWLSDGSRTTKIAVPILASAVIQVLYAIDSDPQTHCDWFRAGELFAVGLGLKEAADRTTPESKP